MAIIKCWNCGRDTTDTIPACKSCGAPTTGGGPAMPGASGGSVNRGANYNPQGQSYNPQGRSYNPQGANYYPQGSGYNPQGQSYNPQSQYVGHYSPGSLVAHLHSFFGSSLYMTGVVLYSAGNLLSILLSFGAAGFFSLLLLALPITSMWLMYSASKSPRLPEKFLTAIKLDKAYAIIQLVLSCLGSLILLFFTFAAGSMISSFGMSGMGGASGALGVVLILILGFLALVIIYYTSYMNVLNGLKNGIESNSFGQLRSIGTYTVFRYIQIGFVVLLTLVSVSASGYLASMMSSLLYSLPSELRGLLSFGGGGSTIMLSTLFSLAASAGEIITIIVLNQYNNSLVQRL